MLTGLPRYSLTMQPPEIITEQARAAIPNVPDLKKVILPENPGKNYVELLTLTTLFGLFGVDRFYLGKIGTGLLKLFTFGGFGLWYCFDAIVALTGGGRQKGSELPLEDTAKYKPFFVRMTTYSAVVIAVITIIQFIALALAIPNLIDQYRGVSGQVQHGTSSTQSQGIQNIMDGLQ